MLMTKGLMDRAVLNELTWERVRDQAKVTEEELLQLQNWKIVTEKKLPVLLREDPKYALEKISSIIGSEDYEDWGTTRRRL